MKKLLLLALLMTSCVTYKDYSGELKELGANELEVRIFTKCWSVIRDKYDCKDKDTFKEAVRTCYGNDPEKQLAFMGCLLKEAGVE